VSTEGQIRKYKTSLSLLFMLKKYIAIFIITIACANLLGHNIIPHHHHETDNELAEHYATNHHHNGEESSNDLSHHLSHFVHPFDDFTPPNNHNIRHTFFRQTLSMIAVLPDHFSFENFFIPLLLHKPPTEHFTYIQPHSLSSGLRAPPAFVA